MRISKFEYPRSAGPLSEVYIKVGIVNDSDIDVFETYVHLINADTGVRLMREYQAPFMKGTSFEYETILTMTETPLNLRLEHWVRRSPVSLDEKVDEKTATVNLPSPPVENAIPLILVLLFLACLFYWGLKN